MPTRRLCSGAASNDFGRGEKARFLSWEILDPRSDSPHMFTSLGPLRVQFVLDIKKNVRRGHHGVALFSMDRQLIWAWSKDDICFEPGLHSIIYLFPMLPLRPGAYAWQVSLWEDGELLDLWDCLPELNIAAEGFQHPKGTNGTGYSIFNVNSQYTMTKATDQRKTVFDQTHYLGLIKSRGALIRRLVPELRSALGFNDSS